MCLDTPELMDEVSLSSYANRVSANEKVIP